MSFSYDPSQLKNNPLFQVRLKLGDTVEQGAFFQDEEILFYLQENSNDVIRTSIDCVTSLLPRLANTTEFSVGPYSEKQSGQAYDYWMGLLNSLKSQLLYGSGPIMQPPTSKNYFYYGMMGIHEEE